MDLLVPDRREMAGVDLQQRRSHGEVLQWGRDAKSISQETYIDGRRLDKTDGCYTPGQKHFEGYYLRAVNAPELAYDWWHSTVTEKAADAPGPDLKHGNWTVWHRNGNKKSEGQYDHGVLTGKFAWWYESGQKTGRGNVPGGAASPAPGPLGIPTD